jgi:UDP:flavonoid glycosyltransferase YjiC (YdhE family)
VRILYTAAPGYGLLFPTVPLIWAARAAGHEVLLATTSEMTEAGARAGLCTTDVYPDRDTWQMLMGAMTTLTKDRDPTVFDELPEEFRIATRSGNPFGLFTLTMTEGTIEAGRAFGADFVVYTSDHAAGRLAATALGAPALEVGNRISWSMRDADFRHNRHFDHDAVEVAVRQKLDIPDGGPKLLARIDPRAPSMGGLIEDEPDERDGVPWWSMRFVPYNGGAVVPGWVSQPPRRLRVCVTLGTVVPIMNGTSSLSVVIDALGAMDVEVILAAGRADLSDLGDLPDNVRSVGFLPLSTFLPTCSAIVHHGGSGTTAAPLYYGVPQLVLPGFADNPMSAQRVADRGVGLSHDPSTVDAPTVRALVHRLLTETEFATAAREVSAEMATQPSPAAVFARATACYRNAEK